MKQEFYAAKNKDLKTRLESSSGGIFMPIASEIIKKNGIVYGAIYDNNNNVIHKRISKKEDLHLFQTSKYVQSELNDTYQKVKKDLEEGRLVLFSGLPCQINALLISLKNINTSNLLTIDLICHGTPQKKYFDDYKKMQEKKYRSRIKNINYRYKTKEDNHSVRIQFENGKEYLSPSEFDIYYQLYERMVKEACFKCPFANLNRKSDITLGDFHEFSSKLKEFNDNKGISLIIINTKKGKRILDEVANNLELIPKTKEECMQPHLEYPPQAPNDYDEFCKDYNEKGFQYIAKKYKRNNIKYKVKYVLYKTNLLPLYKKLKNKK